MLHLTHIVNMSSSPARNIALEECLRAVVARSIARDNNKTTIHLAFFSTYVNAPCVVLGRNQDVASELSRAAQRTGSPRVFRRTTGGGAVYHDRGNLNWSFVVPGSLADREGLSLLVLEALAATGVKATVGARGEIMVGGRKVGGTASAAGKGVLLFHGTLLVDTNIEALRGSLAAHDTAYSPGPVRSVPSTVTNLASLVPGLTVGSLANMLAAHLSVSSSAPWESLVSAQRLEALSREISSYAWIYERSAQPGLEASRLQKPEPSAMKGTA